MFLFSVFFFLKQDAVSLTLGPHRGLTFVTDTYSREGDYIIGAEKNFIPGDQAKSQIFLL